MKDIDDIYDMENYDSDDSPGEYVIAGVYHEHEVCMSWRLYAIKFIPITSVITSLHVYTCNVGFRSRETKLELLS